jgi:diguanylate cyclase (GGDEF)-like protein
VSAENRRKDGSGLLCVWTIAPLIEENGAVTGVLSIVEDVTALARARRLEEFAYQDPVTRLPNRRFFDDRLVACAHSTRRKDDAFALLFIDLDDFKAVNDRFGHEIGDAAVVAVGRRLLDCVRDGDVIARLGGDEFGALLMELDGVDYPDVVAGRILAALHAPLTFGDLTVHVSASIGISMFPLDGVEPGELLRQADAAMYRAKQHGPGTFSR